MVRTFALFVFSVFSLWLTAKSLPVYEISDSTLERELPNTSFGFLKDMEEEYDVHEVYTNGTFVTGKTHVPLTTGGPQTVWLQVAFTNRTSKNRLLLEYRVPLVEHIEFYALLDSGVFTPQAITGINAVSKKKYKEPMYYFDLDLPPGQTKSFLIRIRSNEPIWFPLRVVPLSYLRGSSVKARQLLHGGFAGIMLVMLVYNLLIFLSTRDRSYGIYVAYLLFASFTQFGILGLYQNYFPVFGESLNSISWSWSMVGTGVIGIYFFETFLEIRKVVPKSRYLIYLLYILYGISALLLALGYSAYFFVLVEANAMIVSLIFMPLFAYMAYFKKIRKAKLMLYGWSILMVGIFLYMLKDYGVIPSNNFTDSAIIVGAALQTLLFSLVLGDIINVLKKEKRDSLIKNSRMKQEHEELQLKLKEIQLGSLQQQMNPHFISNALNSVQNYLVNEVPNPSIGLVSLFSKLMRTSLNHARAEAVSIESEVEFLSKYLQMEQHRFPDQFTFQIKVDPQLQQGTEVMIPPLLIQPLCENAVKHAFSPRIENGHLTVSFQRNDTASVKCTIRDNGIGIDRSRVPFEGNNLEDSNSLGLSLVMQRIEILVSQKLKADFFIANNPTQQGTEIQLILPDYTYL